jgi:hypothetical protein
MVGRNSRPMFVVFFQLFSTQTTVNMQSAVGKERPQQRRSYDENVTPAILAYLQTMVLLGKPFGQGYLTRILGGDTEYGFWKSPDPRQFETFGALAVRDWDYRILVLHLMVSHELLEIKDPACNVYEMTAAGSEFLISPYDIYEPKRNLFYIRYEKFLRRQLSNFRKARAESEGIAIYDVMPEFTIDRLTLEKPKNVEDLSEVMGMAYFRVQAIGSGILSVILEAEDDFKASEKLRIIDLVKKPTYQNAKSALNRNSSVAGVAREMGCDLQKAFYYAECLAIAEQVNLKQWIEKQVDASTLFRGAEYFLKTASPNLSEGFRTLGIDYDTLKMCRLYAMYVTPEVSEAIPA